MRVVKQLLRDAAAAYYGDILLPADLDRMAVPPGRDAPAALTSRHRVDAISTRVILPADQARPSGWDGYEIFTVNVVRLTGLLRAKAVASAAHPYISCI